MKKQIFKQTEKKVLTFTDDWLATAKHCSFYDIEDNENSGIYGLKNDKGECVYIGQSNDLYRRLKQHTYASDAFNKYNSEAQRERYAGLYLEWFTSKNIWIIPLQEHNYIKYMKAEYTELIRKGIESLLIYKIKPKYNKPYYLPSLHRMPGEY